MRWAFKRTGAKPLPGGKYGGALGAPLAIVLRFRHALGRRMAVGRTVLRCPGIRGSRIVHMNFRVGCAQRSIAGRFVFGGWEELPADDESPFD